MPTERKPIDAIDAAIASLAARIASNPGMPGGTLSRTVDRITELTEQRAELIRQETSLWREWSGVTHG